MISVPLWQVSVSSAVLSVLLQHVQAHTVMIFSDMILWLFSTRSHRAVAWLQQNPQCHVLAQVLKKYVALLQVCPTVRHQTYISALLSSMQDWTPEHCPCWCNSTGSHASSLLSFFYPTHSFVLVSSEQGCQSPQDPEITLWLHNDCTAQVLMTY